MARRKWGLASSCVLHHLQLYICKDFFGRRGARRHPEMLNARQIKRREIPFVRNAERSRTGAFGDFHETARVGTCRAAQHQHAVATAGDKRANSVLPITISMNSFLLFDYENPFQTNSRNANVCAIAQISLPRKEEMCLEGIRSVSGGVAASWGQPPAGRGRRLEVFALRIHRPRAPSRSGGLPRTATPSDHWNPRSHSESKSNLSRKRRPCRSPKGNLQTAFRLPQKLGIVARLGMAKLGERASCPLPQGPVDWGMSSPTLRQYPPIGRRPDLRQIVLALFFRRLVSTVSRYFFFAAFIDARTSSRFLFV